MQVCVILKGEHGARVRRELLVTRGGKSGSRLGRAEGEGFRGWQARTGLIWLRILRISRPLRTR